MNNIDLLRDNAFLSDLFNQQNKTSYIKIITIDKNDIPIRDIIGSVQSSSLSISGTSSVRRAGSLNVITADIIKEYELSLNTKIQIFIGINNNINNTYDDIIWFPIGIFLITQSSISYSNSGTNISLQVKDKMSLLNGELGGNLPTSVTFDSYDQVIGTLNVKELPVAPNEYTVYLLDEQYYKWDKQSGWDCKEEYKNIIGTIYTKKQRIFDIIQTLVCNFGGEDFSKIIINDIPFELKQIVRYTGEDTLYYNTETSQYTTDEDLISEGSWISFKYNEDCGYEYTDFIYPRELVSAIGDNVCTILDKIIQELGNYQYYYDVKGNFIFEEKKNYLNNQYDFAYSNKNKDYKLQKKDNNSELLLDSDNYRLDYYNGDSSTYIFNENTKLITNYNNNSSYTNLKNDFHVWGKNQGGEVIHYHLAIKQKPSLPYKEYIVVNIKDDNGNYTGKIRLATQLEKDTIVYIKDDILMAQPFSVIINSELLKIPAAIKNEYYLNEELLNVTPKDIYQYTPDDWRAELYLRGLEKLQKQQRPDIYEQELLDLFDSIYDMKEKKFKADIIHNPNDLKYWFDYINPAELFDYSVDAIGSKIYSTQNGKIKRLYNTDIPNVIVVNNDFSKQENRRIIEYCEKIGQKFSRVSNDIYRNLSIGTLGYTAQETMRDLLYKYTNYSETISFSTIPIYHLDVNNIITVINDKTGIGGNYVVNSISIPLDINSQMSISATKALSRV